MSNPDGDLQTTAAIARWEPDDAFVGGEAEELNYADLARDELRKALGDRI
jgi:hypothetical protein